MGNASNGLCLWGLWHVGGKCLREQEKETEIEGNQPLCRTGLGQDLMCSCVCLQTRSCPLPLYVLLAIEGGRAVHHRCLVCIMDSLESVLHGAFPPACDAPVLQEIQGAFIACWWY